jgi:hypothetical protein
MKQLNSQKMTAYDYSINMTVYKALKKKDVDCLKNNLKRLNLYGSI